MKLRIGQKWRTRDGSVLTIVDIYNDLRPSPVIGMFEYGNEFYDYSLSGKYSFGDADSEGDLVELIHDPVSYSSKSQHTIQDVLNYLERKFLVDGKIEFPEAVMQNTANLFQAVIYTLDQENVGEHYDDDEY